MKKDAQLNIYNFEKMRGLDPQHFEWLRLDSNNDCNVHCVYCHNHRSKALIGAEELSVFLDQNVICVENFQVGCIMEPTLDARMADLMGLIASSKAKPSGTFMLQTNGISLHRHDLSKMRDAGLTRVSVSIDAADPAILKSLRGGTSLDKVHANLSALKTKLPEVQVTFITTVTSLNVGAARELVDFGLGLGVARFVFREMFYFPGSNVVDHTRMPSLLLGQGDFETMKRSLLAHFGPRADLRFSDEQALNQTRQRMKADSLR